MTDEEKSIKDRLLPKRPLWKNFLFSDWRDALLFVFVLFMAWAYLHDTAECRQVASDPCRYCQVIRQVPGGELPSINLTGINWPQNVSVRTPNITT